MQGSIDTLQAVLAASLGASVKAQSLDRGQLVVEVAPADLVAACTRLRDDAGLRFTTMLDLIGIDYQGHAVTGEGARYAVVYNLLSIEHNFRVRVRAWCAADDFPAQDSVMAPGRSSGAARAWFSCPPAW